MTSWDHDDPGAGNTSAVTSFASALRTASASAQHAAADATSARSGVSQWTGVAADAWRSSLERTVTHVTSLESPFTTAAQALDDYASSVDSIKQAATTWQDQQRNAQSVLANGSLSGSPGIRDSYNSRLADAQRALTGLAWQRQDADTALIAALAPPKAWAAQRKVLVDAGIRSVKDLDSKKLGKAYADVAAVVAHGGGTAAQRAKLKRFLDAFGTDPGASSAFFVALGGKKTIDLVRALGDVAQNEEQLDQGGMLDMALGLRTALSTGSQGWDADTAKTFAAGLVSAVSINSGIPDLGFLLEDAVNTPMGEELAVALANQADEYERLGGSDGANVRLLQDQAYLSVPGAEPGYLFAVLEAKRNGTDAAEAARVRDGSGRILQQLGAYPAAALGWLDDPKAGADRVTYWFGDREWWRNDGYEGPGALWDGAEKAPGGPGSDTYDAQTWDAVTHVSEHVITALGGNDNLDGHVSERGGAALGDAVAIATPQLANGLEAFGAAGHLPGHDGVVPSITVPDGSIAKVLGAVDRTDAGSVLVAAGATDFQRALVHDAMAHPDKYALTHVLGRLATVQGFVDGSGAGTHLADALQHDENMQKIIGTATDVGTSFVPGLGDVVTHGLTDGVTKAFTTHVVDLAQDHVVGSATESADGWLAQALGFTVDGKLRAQDSDVLSFAHGTLQDSLTDLSHQLQAAGVTADAEGGTFDTGAAQQDYVRAWEAARGQYLEDGLKGH